MTKSPLELGDPEPHRFYFSKGFRQLEGHAEARTIQRIFLTRSIQHGRKIEAHSAPERASSAYQHSVFRFFRDFPSGPHEGGFPLVLLSFVSAPTPTPAERDVANFLMLAAVRAQLDLAGTLRRAPLDHPS